jgi:hypothetical protein
MKHHLRFVILFLGMAASSSAAIFVVDELGNGNFTRIQDAIEWAEDGDRIDVRPGTYKGDINLWKSLEIVGAGPQNTIVVGGLRVTRRSATLRLHGLTITNPSGVGMNFAEYYSDFTMENCVVMGCGGHGVNYQVGNWATLRIFNCTIVGNQGWGVIIDDTDGSGGGTALGVVEGCIIAHNRKGLRFDVVNGATRAIYSNNLLFNTEVDWEGPQMTDSLIIGEDPLFVDYRAGNLVLQAGSPAVNAGRIGQAHLDPDGTANDMGAYGGPGAAAFWPYVQGGPVVKTLNVTPTSVPQGGTLRINAKAVVNDQ